MIAEGRPFHTMFYEQTSEELTSELNQIRLVDTNISSHLESLMPVV